MEFEGWDGQRGKDKLPRKCGIKRDGVRGERRGREQKN